jgi:hypothetical protein
MASYLVRSVVVGLAVAFVAGVLALLAGFAWASLQMWWMMRTSAGSGIGAVAVSIPGLRTVIAMPVGFVLGFYWTFTHRAR